MYISQQIAANAVNQVLAGRNLTMALPAALAQFANATPQQRGAAQDLSYGTLRYYAEIQTYLAQLLDKPLTDDRIHGLLLVAVYQLLHDKADAFTVVNQAVHAVSQLKRPAPKSWAKGLVNAILRNFLRQKPQLQAAVVASEAATYSYPQWWIQKLKQQYPLDWEAMLNMGNQHPPMTLRLNTSKGTMDDYLALLAAQDIAASHLGGQAVLLTKPMPVEQIPGFSAGNVSVQDYGAQLAAILLAAEAGMRVLDACCAPGGKTGHVLELADIEMVGLDSDPARLQRVQSNLDRLGLTAQLSTGDASDSDWWDGQLFDRILADVPCTASGIVRRHVDIKWLRRESDVAGFAAQQAKILPNLWQKLKPGGRLLYATCSVFFEENQGQIARFLQTHADAVQLPSDIAPAASYHNIHQRNGQLIPAIAHDGFFYALLQKN